MVYKTRKRTYSSWNPRAVMSGVNMAAKAARLAYNVSSRTRNTNRRRYTSGQGVTEQYDKKTIYRKKYMPKGKKIRWRRFKKKVYAISEKTLGSRTYVVNTQASPQTTTATTQLSYDVSLYGYKSTENRHNDVVNIVNEEITTDPTAIGGETTDLTTKFIFQSGIMDMTIRNAAFNRTDATTNTPVQVELDIYEVMVGKDTDNTNNDLNKLVDLFDKASGDTKTIGGNISNLTIQSRGATPWDLPVALSRYRIKILKKTKYFLGASQTMTYQYRDPKRRVVPKQRVTERSGFSRPGWTKSLLIIAKSVPGFTVGAGVGETTVKLDIGVTRKYLYKIEGMNDSRDAYTNNTD